MGVQALDGTFFTSDDRPLVQSAYNMVLAAERDLSASLSSGGPEALPNVRVLGYLLQYAPNDDALNHMCSVITSGQVPLPYAPSLKRGEDTVGFLVDLGRYYREHFLRPCELSNMSSLGVELP